MSHNNITGDKLVTKPSSKAYEQGWDAIFGAKKTNLEPSRVDSEPSTMDDFDPLLVDSEPSIMVDSEQAVQNQNNLDTLD